MGACIQCSIKTCKTAYHVTCAFKYGLEMKAIIEDEMADDGVKLRVSTLTQGYTNPFALSCRGPQVNPIILFPVVLSKA